MVTYTEQAAYRHRDRLRRVVVLEGTIEDADSAGNVPLAAGDASLSSIDTVAFETPVMNSTVLSYDEANDQVDLFAQDLTANTGNKTGDTFRVKVTGPVE